MAVFWVKLAIRVSIYSAPFDPTASKSSRTSLGARVALDVNEHRFKNRTRSCRLESALIAKRRSTSLTKLWHLPLRLEPRSSSFRPNSGWSTRVNVFWMLTTWFRHLERRRFPTAACRPSIRLAPRMRAASVTTHRFTTRHARHALFSRICCSTGKPRLTTGAVGWKRNARSAASASPGPEKQMAVETNRRHRASCGSR